MSQKNTESNQRLIKVINHCSRIAESKEVRELQLSPQLGELIKNLAGIHYSKPTNKFQFDSDSMNIRATELFPFAQYGGSYTGGYHQADWEKDKWLTKEAENFPLQYEVTTQKVIVRVSDVNDLNSETHIVCQRPNVFNVPYDSDSYLMMELTVETLSTEIK